MHENIKKSYVITAAQAYQNPRCSRSYGINESAGAPNRRFISSLEKYCEQNEAKLIIQAIRGSYNNEIRKIWGRSLERFLTKPLLYGKYLSETKEK